MQNLNGAHQPQQQQLLRAEQVRQLLGVDRSTVYRMAENGRLPAVKVGRQWRFPADQIRLLFGDRAAEAGGNATPGRRELLRSLPSVLPLIELSAQLLGVMFVITDMDGEPAAGVVNPCPWFKEHWDEPDLLALCLADWKALASDPDFGVRYRTGPLGVDCARVFVRIGSQLVGMLLAGCIDTTGDDPRVLYRLSAEGRERVLTALPIIAAAISRISAGHISDINAGSME